MRDDEMNAIQADRSIYDPTVICEECSGTGRASVIGRSIPSLLDEDGVLVAVTGKPGIWSHAYDDMWWPCPRFHGIEWRPKPQGC